MTDEAELRKWLVWDLQRGGAHSTLDDVAGGVRPEARGKRPEGVDHSPWELLEHIRIAQRDILEFCRNPDYEEMAWPEAFWPEEPAPPTEDAWDASVGFCRADRRALADLVEDPETDLAAPIPWGEGQTILREALLAADHNAYHVGQMATVARLLEG